MKDEQEVESALRRALPPAATAADVRALAARERLTCSDVRQGVMHCSAPAPSRLFFVRAKWLIRFTFAGESLRGIEVTKGLIGP